MHKGIPKSLLSVGLLFATGLLVGSCDQGVTDPEDQVTAPINFVAYAVGVPVSTIVIDVSADDIKGKLVFNLQFNENFVASGLLQVPVGEQRLFSVKTYDDQHNLTHTGEATIDVQPGHNPPLQVKLKPVVGEVDITVSLGDYAVIVDPPEGAIDASGGVTTLQLTVTVLDQYGEEVVDPQVQWATTLPTLATVSPTGLVTGLADGVVDIVASYGGVAGLSKVTLIGFSGGPPPTLSWQRQSSGAGQDFYGVWGSSSANVIAVGGSPPSLMQIGYYDGTGWQTEVTIEKPAYAIWGISATAVFGAGYNGLVMRYDGENWSPFPSPTTGGLWGIWGPSTRDLFAVGIDGVFHFDGNAWSQHTGTTGILYDVWGSSGSDVFAVGTDGVFHFDGTTWSQQESGVVVDFLGIWGSSGSDVFAVGTGGVILHYDGNNWSQQVGATLWDLTGIWGSSGSDVFAVGVQGTIVHFDGTTWSQQESGITDGLTGIWGSSGSDVFAVGAGGIILHYGYN